MTSDLRVRIASVQDRIERAAGQAGRDPREVTLVAVSKTQPLDAVLAAYDLGLRDFGESRLQEAMPKIEATPRDIVWHFIGKLQSNKARRVAEVFQEIHTLESTSQLGEIEKASGSTGGFIEVNIAKEAQKSGIFTENLDGFRGEVLNCSHVQFRGLMTIGPAIDPEGMRPFFRKLRKLNEEVGGRWLSMGMSSDFDVAIQEGATHVRVGSAIFGSRT
jgi:hypothetical protein